MHILILSTGYPTDYVPLDGIFYRDQAEALAAENNQVGFIAVTPISVKSILQAKSLKLGHLKFTEKQVVTSLYKYISIPKLPSFPIQMSRKKGMKMFDEYIKEHGKPDIIHVHCYESGLLAIDVKKKHAIPFVVTEHSSRFGKNQLSEKMINFARETFETSDLNMAVSQDFVKLLSSIFKQEFKYVPNIVDIEQFSINKGKSISPFVFFNAAGLNENKNHVLLLNSFSLLAQKHPAVALRIAGKGSLESELKQLAIDLDVANKVQFLGEISREQIQTEMSNAHAFVLSSKLETFGVVLIEALSSGIPVVSTKCGGPESIITDSIYGEICEQNIKSLNLAMEKVFVNHADYNSDVLRTYVVDNFSNHSIATVLLKTYKSVLNK